MAKTLTIIASNFVREQLNITVTTYRKKNKIKMSLCLYTLRQSLTKKDDPMILLF